MDKLTTTLKKHKYTLLINGLALAVVLGALAAVFFFRLPITPLLFFFPFIVIAAWYRGILAGVIATGISTLGIFYLSLPFPTPLTQRTIAFLIDLLCFMAEGYLISIAIEFYKQTDKETLFKKAEKQYKKRIQTLEEEKNKMQEEIKSRDEFLSIASHELRSPLTSMLLQLQTALNNIQNVSLANFSVQNLLSMLESAEQQSKRLTKMINDLLNVSLITTGRMELEYEQADLTQIVKDVMHRFSEKIGDGKSGITLDADPSVPVTCDKLRIEQVVTNLISNAIKYGKNKPIRVTVRRNNGNATLIVKDDGIGIPKDQYKHIFARFGRAVSGKDYKGLGVGLYITHQIVQAHNGTIGVKSKPGKGTTFEVTLPRKEKKEIKSQ